MRGLDADLASRQGYASKLTCIKFIDRHFCYLASLKSLSWLNNSSGFKSCTAVLIYSYVGVLCLGGSEAEIGRGVIYLSDK